MPRDPQMLIYVGVKNAVVALDERTGSEVWRRELKGSDFVTVMWDGEALIAANRGEVFRLDPRSGAVSWHNELKGLGRGLISLASSRGGQGTSGADVAMAKHKKTQEAAAHAGAAAAAG
jgi:outer membrane protein assembly factor BamB